MIVRLDGHCRPAPDYVRRCVLTLTRRRAGVVGGVWEIEPSAATSVARAIAAVVAHPIGSGGAAYRDAARERGRVEAVDTVPFGSFTRAIWDQVGGYDESLLSNEDYDFNYRVRQSGWSVLLATDIRSRYGARPTIMALGRQYFRYGFWKTQMLKKSPAALRLRQVMPVLVVPWLAATLLLAVAMTDPLTVIAASFYPAAVAVAATHITAARRDARLIVAAFVAVIVQHVSWSAGFWHGLIYPPVRSS